jgi:CRP-like cAMP-binding protein
MTAILDALLASPSLQMLSAEDLGATARHWTARTWPEDVDVWGPGAPVHGMVVLESGAVTVELEGEVVADIEPGDIIAEASAFLGAGTTLLTVRTRAPSRLLILPASALRAMRLTAPAVYDGLLELAMYAHSNQLTQARAAVAHRAAARPPFPARTVRPFRRTSPRGVHTPRARGTLNRPSVTALLRHLPGLATSNNVTLTTIAACFVPEQMLPGDELFREGDPRTSTWILAEGEVDLFRNFGGGSERLARIGAGGLLGGVGLVAPGDHTATCIAVRGGWLYRADPAALSALSGEAWLAWRECLLANLARQLMIADDALRGMRRHAAPTHECFEDLLLASGWHGDLDGLDEVRLVPTAGVWRGGAVVDRVVMM